MLVGRSGLFSIDTALSPNDIDYLSNLVALVIAKLVTKHQLKIAVALTANVGKKLNAVKKGTLNLPSDNGIAYCRESKSNEEIIETASFLALNGLIEEAASYLLLEGKRLIQPSLSSSALIP